MQKNLSFCASILTPPPPKKKFSGMNDVVSMFVHVLPSDCCAIYRAFECRGRLLWTVADKLFIKSSKSVLMAFKNVANISSQNVHDSSYEQKAVLWLHVVYPLLFDQNQRCFLLNKLKGKMCSYTSLG